MFKVGNKFWDSKNKAKVIIAALIGNKVSVVKIGDKRLLPYVTEKCNLKPLASHASHTNGASGKKDPKDQKTLTTGIKEVKKTLDHQKELTKKRYRDFSMGIEDSDADELDEDVWWDDAPFIKANGVKCECGVESTYGKVDKTLHSTWCPIFKGGLNK